MYVRKTKDVFDLEGNYGAGWESLISEDSRIEIRARLKEYRENEGGAYRIVRRRERLEAPVTFNVFVRDWWQKTATGREPGAGPKTYLKRGVVSEDEARKICREYNDTHEPGFLSRKAEFEEASRG